MLLYVPPRADHAPRISVTQPFDKCLIEFSAPILWWRRKDLYEFTEDYPNTLKMGQNNVTIFFHVAPFRWFSFCWIFYGYWKTRPSCFILFYLFTDINNFYRKPSHLPFKRHIIWHLPMCLPICQKFWGNTKHNKT